MKNKKSSDRNIPNPIKRTVRQECGFGCIICGMPFFDYHHIDEFANTQNHTVKNIALLCPEHHAKITRKKLNSLNTVIEYRKNPFNIGKKLTSSGNPPINDRTIE